MFTSSAFNVNIMAAMDEDLVNIGDRVKLCDGERGVIKSISKADTNYGFDRFEIQFDSGKIATEARYRFDVIPSCPGRDVTISQTNVRSVTISETIQSTLTPPVDKPHDPYLSDKDSLEDFDVDRFIASEVNKNTKKKTDLDMKKVRDFFQCVLKENRPLESIPPVQLNKLLCIFFMNVRNNHGKEYEPATIRNMACSIDRYLKSKDYGKQLTTSVEFSKVMEVIKSKQKKLKREGKGNLEKRADAVSDKDIDKLYDVGQLGSHNPDSLLRTVWFLNTVHFGMRGVTEHRDMCWGDIKLCKDSENNEYIEFRERQTKTRPGSNPKNVRAVPPRAWATPKTPSRCPVATYKVYQSRRPPTYCHDDAPYYIATNTNMDKSSRWFKCQPVGVNKLGRFMTTMAENAGLTSKTGGNGKRLTNHSARKYLVQKLNDNGLPPNQIMQISGHKNIQSINNYSTINSNQHRTISRTLSNAHSEQIGQPANNPSSGPRPSSLVSSNGDVQLQNVSNRPPLPNTLPSLFSGPINGGSFTININNKSVCTCRKRQRPRVLYSDSDTD